MAWHQGSNLKFELDSLHGQATVLAALVSISPKLPLGYPASKKIKGTEVGTLSKNEDYFGYSLDKEGHDVFSRPINSCVVWSPCKHSCSEMELKWCESSDSQYEKRPSRLIVDITQVGA
ncbi:hypothetical protein CsSME_00003976 [Camellia sinensis var. sinensis]